MWFARLDLSGTSDAQKRVVQRVCDLLDQLQPARLDPAQQAIECDRGEMWVKLRHDTEPWLDIRLVVSDGWVNFYGVMAHDEAYSVGSEPTDAWEFETIEILASLLLATFTMDRYALANKPWREVVTIGNPYNATVSRNLSPTSLLPLQRWARLTESRHATFECRVARPSG
jgi:hypothetical protein